MINETITTLAEYVQELKALSHMKVIDCYHTQDSVIRLELENNKLKVTLIIDGNWQLSNDEQVICNSVVDNNLNDHDYYEKLRQCAKKIKNEVRVLEEINIVENGTTAEIIFENKWRLNVNQNKFGLIQIENEKTKEFIISTIDEETGKAKYLKSQT